jgi:predicted cupin superfamily sugar epimerase
MNAQQIIKKFNLETHPEGGYFKETYRSELVAVPEGFKSERNYSTSIYFLITNEAFSAFHKVNQDEIWHFYIGSCIHLHLIHPNGKYELIKVGNQITDGEVPQFVFTAQTWFAAEVVEEHQFAFVGCTVSPGFDFKDFELANREALTSKFPNHKNTIKRLTR